jgi:hypothetical protein
MVNAMELPHDDTALTALTIDLAHKLVNARYLNDEGRVHALDHACATLRYRWALEGKPPADCLIDAGALRTVANRTILAPETQRAAN